MKNQYIKIIIKNKYRKNQRIEKGRNIINNFGITDETKESTIKNNNYNVKFEK